LTIKKNKRGMLNDLANLDDVLGHNADTRAKPGRLGRRAWRGGKTLRRLWPWLTAGLAVLFLGLFFWAFVRDSGTVAHGVTIEGQSVGGMTRAQLDDFVESTAQSRWGELSLVLTHEEKTWQFSAAELHPWDNRAEVAARAWAVGRQDGLFARRAQRRQTARGGLALTLEIGCDPSVLRQDLAQVALEVTRLPEDARVVFSPDQSADERFRVVAAREGVSMDVDAVLEQIKLLFEQSLFVHFALPVTRTPAALQAKDLAEVTQLRSRVDINISALTPLRLENLMRAAALCSGQQILPGKSFSFNRIVGARGATYNLDLLDINPESFDGPGGSVAIAASAIYKAALLAELSVTARTAPDYPAAYIEAGLGAKVSKTDDLVIQNNEKLPVLLSLTFEGQNLVCRIYGTPLTDVVTLETASHETGNPPAGTETRQDTSGLYAKPGQSRVYPALPPMEAEVTRVRIRPDGTADRESLHTDHYAGRREVVLAGVEVEEDATEE